MTSRPLSKLPAVVVNKKNLYKSPTILKKIGSIFKEEVIYESVDGDFLKNDTPVKLINKHNILTKTSVTIARHKCTVDRTSDNITNLIGQSNYEILLSALCSVINQELKVRGILALLTVPRKKCDATSQTDPFNYQSCQALVANKACQTDNSFIDIFDKPKSKVRKRNLPAAYVVTEPKKSNIVNKVIIDPNTFKTLRESEMMNITSNDQLPVLNFDENSNESVGKFSTITVNSLPELLKNPFAMLDVDKVTAPSVADISLVKAGRSNTEYDWSGYTDLELLDGTMVRIPLKVEDQFHIGTLDVLKSVAPELRKKIMWYQAYIDWKFCLNPDEDNYLPIHIAAANGDLELLRRQCTVLKSRNESVDLPNGANSTALQLSIADGNSECTSLLLTFGADLMTTDESYKNCFHLAAESDPGHLQALVKHCRNNASHILQENEELWTPSLSSHTEENLVNYLLKKLSVSFDADGNTPLMLASSLGKYENVKMLLDACPETINTKSPSSGNTALYFAVEAACLDCAKRNNLSKVSTHYRTTIELLVENGADASIQNYSGSSVNTILTEVTISELSMIIANRLTLVNCFNGEIPGPSTKIPFILLKHKDGSINVKNITEKQKTIKNTKKINIINEKVLLNNPNNKMTVSENSNVKVKEKPANFNAMFKSFVSTSIRNECNSRNESSDNKDLYNPKINNSKINVNKKIIIRKNSSTFDVSQNINIKRSGITKSAVNSDSLIKRRKKS